MFVLTWTEKLTSCHWFVTMISMLGTQTDIASRFKVRIDAHQPLES